MAKDLKEVERAFADIKALEFDERDGVVAVRCTEKWQDDEDWSACCDIADELGGRFEKGRRIWLIPLEKPAPPSAGQDTLPKEAPYSHLKPEIAEKVKEAEAARVKEAEVKEGYQLLPVERIMFAAKKLRQTIDEDYIREVAETVKSLGVIEPILVRPSGDGWYEVVVGEQRVRASKMAGMKNIPSLVKRLSDWEAFETSLVENLQRKDLTDYETAKALKRALADFPDQFPDQKTLAFSLGKSENWVSNHLAILELEGKIPARTLQGMTHTQAREFRVVPEEKREEILKEIAESGMLPSSREIEARAKPPETEAKPLPSVQTIPITSVPPIAIPTTIPIAIPSVGPVKKGPYWWTRFEEVIPKAIINDVDHYVDIGGPERKRRFLLFYLEILRKNFDDVTDMLEAAEKALSDAESEEATEK